MFQLRPLHAEIDSLGLGRLQLCIRLGDVDPTGDTGLIAVPGNLQRALVAGDGLIEQSLLGIIDAQLEIALHQRRLGGE